MPSSAGSPTCTGAPCTAGKRAVTAAAVSTSPAGTGRIDTTSGPVTAPASRQRHDVRYIATFTPCSTCRTGTPASASAVRR